MIADARGVAARLLLAAERPGDFLENRLERDPAFVALPGPDRRLCQDLVFGTLRWQRTLDWLSVEAGARRPPPPPARILLRLGLYQLFWLDRIPEFAAVHETVRIAAALGAEPLSGFLNAVLRKACRDRISLENRLQELRTSQPAVGWSHPDWLVKRWVSAFGDEVAHRLLEWNNSPPSTLARCNRLKGDPGELTSLWEKEGVEFEPKSFPWIEDGTMFVLRPMGSLSELPSFKDGRFYIQDPSTLLAVRQLEPKPGDSILDLCAAPGGKTTMIAQIMENRGTILATDESQGRLNLLVENCNRLGISCVTPQLLLNDPIPAGPFDRVLVDSPCSNTGVLRRRIQLRWRLREEEIARLARVQTRLLHEASQVVKPGGRLVYSTCSLESDENRNVVAEFIRQHPEFSLLDSTQLHPVSQEVDGAFIATFERSRS